MDYRPADDPYVLTLVDTTAIQRYIFTSNTLKHIVGASGLGHLALYEWLDSSLDSCGRHNIRDGSIVDELTIEKDGLQAELIYRGGGNALILFENFSTAYAFTGSLTLKLLKDAPGLELVVAHQALPGDVFIEKGASVGGQVQELFQKINQKKLDRKHSLPLSGLGVTAACPYTQKPATQNLENEWVSSEIKQKVVVGNKFALGYFNEKFKQSRGGYEFIGAFNEFSGEEKGSYMAVVHADGTGMGKRLIDLLELNKDKSDREVLVLLREFSKSITQAVQASMDKMISHLCVYVEKGIVPKAKNALPFRPIVCEGDDITFVCDGRVGISLAAILLKAMAKQPLSDGRPIAARAGVAIVKSHFPFSQAYHLSEELNHSPRNFSLESKAEGQPEPPMAMDWHISTDSSIGRLADARKKYRPMVKGTRIDLLLRPVLIKDHWRSWDSIERTISEFNFDPAWMQLHSKLRTLQDEYNRGGDAIARYLAVNKTIPKLPDVFDHVNGFTDGKALYYDALEAMDFFLIGTSEVDNGTA